jgi:glutamine amidotransferase
LSSVLIVDSGGANIASLRHALARLGVEARLSAEPADIRSAERVILPGVGAAGDAMRRLREAGLDTVIPSLRQPVLGICLGMQLLFERSEEGNVACLGILPGSARRIPGEGDLAVPHMGWNQLDSPANHPLLEGVPAGSYLYFVHSYAVPPGECTMATCQYGRPFSAVVGRENFFGMQFHPERSAEAGARLLGNFLGLQSCN